MNAAAYTAVDAAETDAEAAYRANRDGPALLARLCADGGIPLIHVSTDYVFDGLKGTPYVEGDSTSPTGVYGASKLAGERAVLESGARAIVLRTSWVYAATGKNFVRTMLGAAQRMPRLRVVADQKGCPTNAADLAAAILTIAARLDAQGWDDRLAGVGGFAGSRSPALVLHAGDVAPRKPSRSRGDREKARDDSLARFESPGGLCVRASQLGRAEAQIGRASCRKAAPARATGHCRRLLLRGDPCRGTRPFGERRTRPRARRQWLATEWHSIKAGGPRLGGQRVDLRAKIARRSIHHAARSSRQDGLSHCLSSAHRPQARRLRRPAARLRGLTAVR